MSSGQTDELHLPISELSTTIDDDASSKRSLGDAAVSGVKWVGMARGLSEVAAFGGIVVTSHHIPPVEFGRAAVAMLINELAIGVGTQGISTPLVQRAHVGEIERGTAMVLSLVSGVLLTLVTVAFALLAVPPIFDQRTGDLMALIAPVFFLSSVAGVPSALIQRRLDFKSLGIIDAASTVVGTALTIVLAFAGLDGEALILGVLATAAVLMAGSLASAPWSHLRWNRQVAREIRKFGLPALWSGIMNLGTRNVDYILVGARMGPTTLGFYSRAYRIGVEYQSKISAIMLRLSLGLYSAAGGLDEVRRIRGRIVRVHALILFPPILIVTGVAPMLVPFVFGPEWKPAVEPTQILTAAGVVATVMTGIGPLLLSQGHPKVLLWFNAVSFATFGGAVALATSHGVIAVCVAGAAAQFVLMVGAHVFVLRPLLGIPPTDVVREVVPPLAACGPLVAIAFAGTHHFADSSPWLVLPAVSLVASLSYLVTLRLVFRREFDELLGFLRRVTQR